jgi:hypothetical protein
MYFPIIKNDWAKLHTMYELKKECEQLHTLSCPLLEHKVFAAPKVESMNLLHKEEMKAMRILLDSFFFFFAFISPLK